MAVACLIAVCVAVWMAWLAMSENVRAMNLQLDLNESNAGRKHYREECKRLESQVEAMESWRERVMDVVSPN